MQNTTKVTQDEHAERVDLLYEQLPAPFYQISATQTKSMKGKWEITELSNLIIYDLRVK